MNTTPHKLIICGDYGEYHGSKFWHSNSKYRRVVWQCNAKFQGAEKCHTPHLYEEDLKRHFITALSELLTTRTALLEDGALIQRELLDCGAIDREFTDLLQDLDVVSGMTRHLVDENATHALPQASYIERYNSLAERYEGLQTRYDALQQQKERRQIQADAIGTCLTALSEVDLLQISFSEPLWNTVIDHVTVCADERLAFHFKNGAEREVRICT